MEVDVVTKVRARRDPPRLDEVVDVVVVVVVGGGVAVICLPDPFGVPVPVLV